MFAMETKMEENRFFEEYLDSIFKHSNLFSKKEYEQHCLEYEVNYSRFIPPDKNVKTLDIGCGAGHFLYFFKKKGYKNFLGIDISQQQVDFCKKNVSKQVERADAVEFLKDRDNDYEVIVANDLLEHIPKKEIVQFLALVNKALKPDGVFMMRTPNLGNPFAISLRYQDFTHTIGFTEKSLYQALWVAGFRDIKIVPLRQQGLKSKVLNSIIQFILSKLFWHQGFVAPKILTPVLIGIAKKCEKTL